MKTHTIDIKAGQSNKKRVDGNFFLVRSMGSPFSVMADNSGQQTQFDVAGDWWEATEDFQDLVFFTDIDQRIEIKAGFGRFGSRSVVGEVDANILVPANYSANTATITAVSLIIAAANSTQKKVIITPDVAAYIGPLGTPEISSRLYVAGAVVSFDATYDIYARAFGVAGAVDGCHVERELI